MARGEAAREGEDRRRRLASRESDADAAGLARRYVGPGQYQSDSGERARRDRHRAHQFAEKWWKPESHDVEDIRRILGKKPCLDPPFDLRGSVVVGEVRAREDDARAFVRVSESHPVPAFRCRVAAVIAGEDSFYGVPPQTLSRNAVLEDDVGGRCDETTAWRSEDIARLRHLWKLQIGKLMSVQGARTR